MFFDRRDEITCYDDQIERFAFSSSSIVHLRLFSVRSPVLCRRFSSVISNHLQVSRTLVRSPRDDRGELTTGITVVTRILRNRPLQIGHRNEPDQGVLWTRDEHTRYVSRVPSTTRLPSK